MAIASVYADAHLAGTFTNPANAVGNTPTTWAGQVNANVNETSRWSMTDTPDSLTPGATQTVRVVARKGTNSGTPTIALNLYHSGTLVRSILAATNVTSTTGETLTATFTDADVPSGVGVEIEVVATSAGGSGSVRNAAQISHIEWAADTSVGVPSSSASGSWTRSGSARGTAPSTPPPSVDDPYGQQVLSLSPTVFLRLDETTGNYTDYSGNGYDGVVTDADNTLVRDSVGGPASTDTGHAIYRTNGGDTIHSTVPATGNVFTMEAWVRLNSTPPAAHQYAVFLDTGATDPRIGMVAWRNATGNRFALWDNVSFWRESTTSLTTAEWHHLVVVVNGVDTSFYADGVFLNTVTVATAPATTFTRLSASATQTGYEFVLGYTDEVALYPTALTAAQIKANYDAAFAAAVPSSSASGSWTRSGSAAGSAGHGGTATGSWTRSGSAAGSASHGSTASGSWTRSGSASGSAPVVGTNSSSASGSWTRSGSASGSAPVVGVNSSSASGSWTRSGSASGSTTRGSSASGSWTRSGSASGSKSPGGSASGSWTRSGFASGSAPSVGVSNGSASGSWTRSGSASGSTSKGSTASGSWTRSGSASGSTSPSSSASGSWTRTGSASGSSPAEGLKHGSASGTWTRSGSAAGSTLKRGATSGTWTRSGFATGSTSRSGSASGSWTRTGTASGSALVRPPETLAVRAFGPYSRPLITTGPLARPVKTSGPLAAKIATTGPRS